jgi:catechol 2,3-dioxygenase-like lactoylglutathione lyase family enzyme
MHVQESPPSETPGDRTAELPVKEATGLTSTQTYDQTPDSEISVDVVSTVVRVRELDRSLKFYCDVFSCRVVVREADMALLLTPKGFEIYLLQKDELHTHGAGALGVHYLMWATDSQSAMQRITDRLRAYDSAVYSHTVEGMTILEGIDPDGLRVIVAYPTPRRLPRTAIAERLRG